MTEYEYGVFVPGIVNKDIAYADAYTRSITEIKKAIPLAEELGVAIAIENVWNKFLLSPLEAAAFVDERPTGGVILIDDIRFPEECAALAAVVPVYAYRLEGGDVGDGHVSESGAGLEGFASLTPDFADANFAWLNPVRVACGLPDLCAYRVSA